MFNRWGITVSKRDAFEIPTLERDDPKSRALTILFILRCVVPTVLTLEGTVPVC